MAEQVEDNQYYRVDTGIAGSVFIRNASQQNYVIAHSDSTGSTSITGGNVGIGETTPTSRLHVGGDIDNSKNFLVNSQSINDLQTRSSFKFDGSDDKITIDADSSFENIFTNGGTISGWINPKSDGEGNTGTILTTLPNSGTADGWAFRGGDESGGFLRLSLHTFWDDAGASRWQTAVVVPINQWTHYSITLTANNKDNDAIFYLNGVAQPIDNYANNVGSSAVIDDDSGNDLIIGNHSGSDYTFDGEISKVRLYNRVLTAEEVKNEYSGQAVPYQYVGASQTQKISATLDRTFSTDVANATAFDATYQWQKNGASTITVSSNVLTVAVSSFHQGIWYPASMEPGKTYRLTFDATTVTGAWEIVGAISGNYTKLADISSGLQSYEFTTLSGMDGNVIIVAHWSSWPATLVIDASSTSVTMEQIGCVAEYLPESVSPTSWLDSSGNELDGSVSGATAVNAEAGIVGRDSHLVESKTVADLQSGASFDFPGSGTNDAVLVSASSESVDIFDGGGSTTCWVYARSTSSGRIVLKDGNGTTGGWNLGGYGNSGTHFYFDFLQYFSGDDGRWITPENISLNEWHHLAVTYDNGSASNLPTLYVDGVAQAVTASSTPTGTRGSDSGYAIYVGNRQALARSWDGQISQVRLHNRALSAAEVRAAYNGQAVPFEYVGGSQDIVIPGDFTGDLDGWSAGTGGSNSWNSQTNPSNNMVLAASATDQYCRTAVALVEGKKYRCTYTASSTAGTPRFSYYVAAQTAITAASGSSAITDGTHSFEFTFPAAATNGYFYISSATSSDAVTLDDVSVTQIGCVAEYLPSGISATQWVDTSGNNLHGTTSTATAVNHTTGTLTLESGANLKMQDGGGIDFSNYTGLATAGTATANLLDDYEEGTFTPNTNSDATGAFSATASHTTGDYIKVGRTVHIQIVMTVHTTFTNNLIAGLPFAPAPTATGSGWYGMTPVITASATNSPVFALFSNGTTVEFMEATVYGAAATGSKHLPNSTPNNVYRFGFTYMAAN